MQSRGQLKQFSFFALEQTPSPQEGWGWQLLVWQMFPTGQPQSEGQEAQSSTPLSQVPFPHVSLAVQVPPTQDSPEAHLQSCAHERQSSKPGSQVPLPQLLPLPLHTPLLHPSVQSSTFSPWFPQLSNQWDAEPTHCRLALAWHVWHVPVVVLQPCPSRQPLASTQFAWHLPSSLQCCPARHPSLFSQVCSLQPIPERDRMTSPIRPSRKTWRLARKRKDKTDISHNQLVWFEAMLLRLFSCDCNAGLQMRQCEGERAGLVLGCAALGKMVKRQVALGGLSLQTARSVPLRRRT
jgi:hypothetical protein